MDRLRSKFVGSLVGAGVGDWLGAGSTRYTDDTAMMIGVAESLLDNGKIDVDHMGGVFVRNYDAEPWRGYGPGPAQIFEMVKSGVSWGEAAERIYDGGSYGNGAAMRICPIGVFYYDEPGRLREAVYACSRITHAHRLGIEGAVLQAYAVGLAVGTEAAKMDRFAFLERLGEYVEADLYLEKLKRMRTLLRKGAEAWRVIGALGNTAEAYNSVPISIYSFLANVDFRGALECALSFGGDRDTIGAMTGAIAGACYGVEAIPAEWRGGLENRGHIEGLGARLWRLKCEAEGRL